MSREPDVESGDGDWDEVGGDSARRLHDSDGDHLGDHLGLHGLRTTLLTWPNTVVTG